MFTEKKESWKTALNLTKEKQKEARQIKSITDKKERIAYSNSGYDADGRR
jgi:hypothetical protein